MLVTTIEALDPQEAAKLLHKLNMDNPNFRVDLATLSKHAIFTDFKFTPK
jgi:hypothetical protein